MFRSLPMLKMNTDKGTLSQALCNTLLDTKISRSLALYDCTTIIRIYFTYTHGNRAKSLQDFL
jgi:hypothetical protein